MTFTLLITISSLTLFSILENVFPRVERPIYKNWRHTLHNLLIASVAIGTSQGAYGLVKNLISFPRLFSMETLGSPVVEAVICVLFFDFVSWVWHWSNHHVAWLWRSHAVHHSDPLLNASSALRFHPFELFPSLIIRGALAAALGFSSTALMVFTGLYVFMNFFEHSHLRLPKKMEDALGMIFITPSLHHLHHSTDFREQNTNLGTIFSFWDRAFGYRLINSHTSMDYGVIPNQPKMGTWRTLNLPIWPVS